MIDNELKPSYYAVAPAKVRYCKDLSFGSKSLYYEITALTNQKGYCWATNGYFAGLYEMSEKTISRWVQELVKSGLIRVEIDQKSGNVRRMFLTDAEVKVVPTQKDPTDKKISTYGQKCPEPMDENVQYNTKENIKENKREENIPARSEKPKRVKTVKPTLTPEPETKPLYVWRMENNTVEGKERIKQWSIKQAAIKIQQLLSSRYALTYSLSDCERWAAVDAIGKHVEMDKVMFDTVTGEILSTDLERWIVNSANKAAETGKFSLPKQAAQQVKVERKASIFD